jgi:hypothetical protein
MQAADKRLRINAAGSLIGQAAEKKLRQKDKKLQVIGSTSAEMTE